MRIKIFHELKHNHLDKNRNQTKRTESTKSQLGQLTISAQTKYGQPSMQQGHEEPKTSPVKTLNKSK